MTVFWVALITLIVWGVSRARRSGSGGGINPTPPRGEAPNNDTHTAGDILDRRFAAGQLDEDTYRTMHSTLYSSRTTRTESQ